MNNIGALFDKEIDRPIEEVIKVDQTNEKAVATEINEYVATDSIRDQFADVFKEIAEGQAAPREGIGVWISGFFGAGKSLFAKILGYAVANKKVGKTTAAAIFKKALNDSRVSDLVDSINTRIPFEAIIFDVSMDRGVRTASERLTEIMYRALLRELGYCEDFDLAEMEIALEADKRLKTFEKQFETLHGHPWRIRRQLGLAINEASAAMHKLDPNTYPAADSYAIATGKGRADVNPNKLARRAFELAARRAPGKALIFIMDEVGQFVARSVEKMLDLNGIVQAMGVEGRNRTERREAVSPFWIIVTSQEKLNEVVTALDSKKIELARLQDRFRITVDLKQSDITQVTAQRVLSKKKEAVGELEQLYDPNSGRIKECCTLERTARNLEINRKEFVRLYPYLPYQMELCIDIVSGLRLKRGAHRHVGGSNRTLIKQAQQMMINDRTRLADAAVGTLVTLDKVYELLEVGNLLPSEVSQEIAHVATRLGGIPVALRVVKAIALLESVKDLPRTPHNLAVVLHPEVHAAPIRKEIETALAELEKAQFIRNTEDGYKLLTVQEKNWETNRNGIEPREADRHRIHREMISEIFSEPKIRTHSYKNLRSFRMAVTLDGESVVADGDVMLNLSLAEPPDINKGIEEARNESNVNTTQIFWVAPLPKTIRDIVTELYRSREMVSEYDRLASQQRLTNEESACLANEKTRRDRYHRQLRTAMVEIFEAGQSFSQGVNRDAKSLGQNMADMIRGLLETAIPILYPKLVIGALPLAGGEAEKLLTAANLNGLPKVFFNDKTDLSLMVKQGGQFVPNLGCELCRDLLDYLRREHAYGNKVTGKMVETHFSGIGFGWELESIRLGIAILFRGGALEVSHQGRKYRHYTEPPARQPFVSNPAFRAASFSPREALDLKVLAGAARMYEEITGKDVNIEEGAIAQAFKEATAADREKLVPLCARLSALQLPGAEAVRQHLKWVEGILDSPPDDCVKTLAFEGKTYLENRKVVEELNKAATDENVAAIRTAGRIIEEQWPLLRSRYMDGDLQKTADELSDLLKSDDCLRRVEAVKIASQTIGAAYRQVYAAVFDKRGKVYDAALETIKGRPEWLAVSENPDIPKEKKDAILQPLAVKASAALDLPAGATVCRSTGATLAQLESETQAVDAIASQALLRLMELAAPKEKIEKIAVAKLYPARITSEKDLRDFLKALQGRLEKILAQGGSIILE
ncbi:MAG: BREX system P-loop protein BrxC [bacterium]